MFEVASRTAEADEKTKLLVLFMINLMNVAQINPIAENIIINIMLTKLYFIPSHYFASSRAEREKNITFHIFSEALVEIIIPPPVNTSIYGRNIVSCMSRG